MTIEAFGITALSMGLLATWVVLLWRARPPGRTALVLRFSVALVAWAALWFGLASAGLLADVMKRPPLFALLPPALVIGVVVIARSRIGALIAIETPLWLLVGMQGFRLPLELVMHHAAQEGALPIQMTFGPDGRNYDILTGASALLLGVVLFVRRGQPTPRSLVLGFNIAGSLLLANIVVVAVLSTPLFARFGSEPKRLNTWVLHAPFVWLPAILVGSALLGHVLIFQRLRAR